MATYKSYATVPTAFINGLQIYNDTVSQFTKLNVDPGVTNDSSNTFSIQVSTPLSLLTTVTGLGGIDTGTIANVSYYYVYLIWDAVNSNVPALTFSLSSVKPQMPFGYNAYKYIGGFSTDSSAHIIPGNWTAGNTGRRTFLLNNQRLTLTGTASTATNFSLLNLVPAIDSSPAYINMTYTSTTPGSIASVRVAGSATGFNLSSVTQVSGVIANANGVLISSLVSGVPTLNYSVQSGSVSIYVLGYDFLV